MLPCRGGWLAAAAKGAGLTETPGPGLRAALGSRELRKGEVAGEQSNTVSGMGNGQGGNTPTVVLKVGVITHSSDFLTKQRGAVMVMPFLLKRMFSVKLS